MGVSYGSDATVKGPLYLSPEQIERVPRSPGVYILADAHRAPVYVGADERSPIAREPASSVGKRTGFEAGLGTRAYRLGRVLWRAVICPRRGCSLALTTTTTRT